ncbi:MAG TPA: hypothetical protein ENK04_03605 [Gammaproteobacteria bacterium]|nr:hypothetical protein [Gammaproteobacteria bacterium]
MDWLKIGSAIFLIMMLVYLFPSMRQAVKHGRKGSNKEWLNYLLILLVVGLFVMFLIQMV